MNELYSNEQNKSRIADIYERIFSLKQCDKNLIDYYSEFKSMKDELKVHRPCLGF